MKLRGYIVVLIFLLPLIGTAQKNVIIDSLQNYLQTVKTDTGKINTLNALAYEFYAKDPERSRSYSLPALRMADSLGYVPGQIQAHSMIGLSYYNVNKYDEAMKEFEKGRVLAEKTNDRSRLSIIMNNIGLIYDDKADFKNALAYYFKSLSLTEQSNNTKQSASTLNNIAIIYQNMGKFDDALKYHQQALKIKLAIGYKKGVGSTYHNLGTLYKLKGEYRTSLEYYEKALAVRRDIQDEAGIALTLNNIGSLYESMKDYNKALDYFQQAMQAREHLQDNYNLGITMISLGTTYCNLGDYNKGFDYLSKAMKLAGDIGAKDLLRYGYEALAEFSAKQGNFEKAYNYQRQLILVKDSIFNSETATQLNELQTKYESEKQEREIQLLTKDKQIRDLEYNRNRLFTFVLITVVLLVLVLAAFLYNRYKVKQRANEMLQHHNHEITQQKKEITDSINYAKRIQESILPPADHWNRILPESFIFYRPKDIVSGDFYWIEQKNGLVCFAAVDCTGHGVPGALMSVVGFNLLTQAVNEVGLTAPSEILKHLDAGVTKTLRQSEAGKGVKDGMDLSLCTLDPASRILQYAGAFNSLYYVSGGVLHEIKADKFPIGVNVDEKVDEYRNHRIQLQAGDCVYLFSDGYADQFGGPRGKKFKYNQLKDLLAAISTLPLAEQKARLEANFDEWKGELEQVDDVVIIGVRVS